MTDGDILTRWHAGREQRGGDSITIDLGQTREVCGVELLIGGFIADFPRHLSIATSDDGGTWSDAWAGGTAMLAFAAALEDPRNVTLPLPFHPRPARYLRLTQNGSEPVYYWSIAELHVRGR
jgi:endo-1,3(4)-beta-glucanase